MTRRASIERAAAGSRTERLLVRAAFITCLGNSIQLTASALLLVRSGSTTLAVGWLFIAVAAPQVLFSVLGGRIADRYDRRMLSVACDVAAAVAALALPLWLVLGGPTTAGAYTFNLTLAIAAAIFMPVSNALIKERVRHERLGTFNANFEVATQAGTLLSAAVGGFLLSLLSIEALLFFNGLTFVASALMTFAIGRRQEPVAGAGDAPRAEEGQAKPARPLLARLGLLYAVGNVVITLSNTLIVVLVIESFRSGPGALGMVDALAGIGILTAAAAYKRASRRFGNLTIAFAGYVGCAGLIALEPISLMTMMLVMPFAGLSFGLARVAARTMLMAAVPEERAGRVFGATNAFGLGFSVAATIAIASIADGASIASGFLALALLVAGTTSLAVLSLWRTGRPARFAAITHPEPTEAGA